MNQVYPAWFIFMKYQLLIVTQPMKIRMNSIRTKIMAVILIVLLISLGTVITLFSIMSIRSTEELLYELMKETSKTAGLAMENRLESSRRLLNEFGTMH